MVDLAVLFMVDLAVPFKETFAVPLAITRVVDLFVEDFGVTELMSPLGVLAIIALLTTLRFAIKDFFSTVLPPVIFVNLKCLPSLVQLPCQAPIGV